MDDSAPVTFSLLDFKKKQFPDPKDKSPWFMVCITGLEHHVSQLADLCPPAGSLLHLDVAPVQEVLPPVFPRHRRLWWGPPHHPVCVRHESQGTPRGKQRDPTGRNWTQEIPQPLSSVGPTSTFCLFCHTDEKDSFFFRYFIYFYNLLAYTFQYHLH